MSSVGYKLGELVNKPHIALLYGKLIKQQPVVAENFGRVKENNAGLSNILRYQLSNYFHKI